MEPSKKIVRDAAKVLQVMDGDGRRIEFRRPTALDTLRLLKAAGPELSNNEAWLAMASLAFAVTSIDGVPTPQPSTEGQIEGLILTLGHSGIAAITNELDKGFISVESSVGN